MSQIPYSYNGGFNSFGNNLGFSSSNFSINQVATLQNAKSKATAKGQGNWAKGLDFVLQYGGAALTILTQTGVIRNKNIQNIQNAEYDEAALNKLLQANGGSLNRSPEAINQPSRNALIDFSNPIVIILIVAVVVLFSQKKGK